MENKKGRNLISLAMISAVVCFAGLVWGCDIGNLFKNDKPVLVSALAIAEGDFSLTPGETKQLNVSVEPGNAADRTIRFESDRPDLAEVDTAGLVTAKSPGAAAITALAVDGSGVTDTVTVTVLPEEPAALWEWKAGDGYETGQAINGEQVLTIGNAVTLDAAGNLVLVGGSRFTVGIAEAVETTSAFMPEGGAFDFSKKTTITLTYTAAAGNFMLYVNNNTTSAPNSVLGSGSKLYDNAPSGGKVEAVIDPEYFNNDASLKNAFLQFRSPSAGAITISNISVVYGDPALPETSDEQEDPPAQLVESIYIQGGNFGLAAGASRTLVYEVWPETAQNKQLSWSSSDGAVASVSNGFVRALSAGQAKITAETQDGSGKSAFIWVTVVGQGGDSPQAQAAELFAALKGESITTNGWADMANSGAGLWYTNPASYTLIDDAAYPSASAKLAAFKTAIENAAETFIVVSGDIDLSDGKMTDTDHSYFEAFDPVTHNRLHGDITLNINSQTVIIGINDARIKYGGLRINNRTNVIIRNLTFWDAHGSTEKDTSTAGNSESKASIDALVIQGDSNGVWVDHCTFTDGLCEDLIRNYNHDGAFDIPKGKNITVSWCEFTNHDKVMLVAGSDSAGNAIPEDRQITLHHNYFHDKVTQRMPRSRGTQMHIYNNYYNNIGVPANTGYSLGPGYGSQFIVENNYFGTHTAQSGNGIVKYFDKSAAGDNTFSRFYQSGNIPSLSNDTCTYDGVDKLKNFSAHLTDTMPWTIPYSYTPDSAVGLVTSIPAGAGCGLSLREIQE